MREIEEKWKTRRESKKTKVKMKAKTKERRD